MIRHLAFICLVASLLPQAGAEEPEPTLLSSAEVLPLALDDRFEFRKAIVDTLSPESVGDSTTVPSQMLLFQRKSKLQGAIGNIEERERYGEYFTFFWRSSEPADITVRLEYRQQNLGAYVQAQEVAYTGASGTVRTRFRITGDDFERDGAVTSWRALLVKEGRIVAIHTSALWD